MKFRLLFASRVSLGVAAFAPALSASPTSAQPVFQMYIGGYPQAETSWSNDTQGIAHDDNHWFITQTEALWKIPVGLALHSVTATSPGVLRRGLGFYQALAGFDHTGDPVVYKHNGVDYLLVPLEGPGRPGTIAIFHCGTMNYMRHFALPGQAGDAGWCAVDESGIIYSSPQHTSILTSFTLDWDRFQLDQTIVLGTRPVEVMRDEQGNILDLVTMQGGEFGPGGLLYLASGFYTDSNALADREGLHIMEKRTDAQGNAFWQRIGHSTRGFGHFDYYYNPGTLTGAEEPEGLTIWDLDDGRAPGIRGQLHATVLSNEIDAGDIDFKHYTHIIRVQAGAGCVPNGLPRGGPTCPFLTVGSAMNIAWNGAEVRVWTGAYPEPMVVSKRVRLTAEGGLVRIGGT